MLVAAEQSEGRGGSHAPRPGEASRYSDIPAPLGTVVAEYRIAPGSAIAYPVTQGQYIQIIDVCGSQCSDFLAFSQESDGIGPQQEIDSTVTRTLSGVANPQAGLHSKYFSQTLQPLVEVIQATCTRHDSFLLACTSRYYEDAGYPGHPSCSENFNRVLSPYGIGERAGWPAINFFFNTEVDCHGNIVAQESWSRSGDYVLLQAHQNLLCASSACPDDIDPANGWEPTPIHVRIYAAQQDDKGDNDGAAHRSFARAIGRRVAADFPLRLTQGSAFTPRIQQLTDDLAEYNGFWVPNKFAYQGDQAEYWALRQRAALMDLSALRKFELTGSDAFALLQYAFSRNLEKVTPGRCAYGCLPNPHGGIIDDGIVFCFSPTHYRYVGNCDTDGDWLRRVAQQQGWTVKVETVSDRIHNLALQGPKSRDILTPLVTFAQPDKTLSELAYFRFAAVKIGDIPLLLSRTGYTGELGYELFVDPLYGEQLWDMLMSAGKSFGLQPLGMQALDRARIEAGLLASGIEFDDLTSPYQAGIGWSVSLKKPALIGKAALETIRTHPPKVAVGLVLEGLEIATSGQGIYAEGERWRIGHITSATFSPILNRSIAMAQVVPEYAEPDTVVEIGLLDGFKRRVRAKLGPLAAFDPSKSRVRL
ncbi:MAG: DUF1989 domain-containing protein [Cyanobacteria bacterium J06623_5]